MREMVFRERQERVAHLDAISKMVARTRGVNEDKAFADIIGEYASEVFQETYDADLLKRKIAHRRLAQARVRAKRRADEELINKLNRMETLGEKFDRENAKKPK